VNGLIFTSDLDWAPDWTIRQLINTFQFHRIPLTLFVTHDSQVVNEIYDDDVMRRHVGLHPNFGVNSTHGSTMDEVVANCQKLWPSARSFRSHCFVDSHMITEAMYARGFKYDSNLCLFLQRGLVPLEHESGLVRFPVWWEDDVHARRGLPWSVEFLYPYLKMDGLKVFNIHPIWFTRVEPSVENLRFLENLLQFINDSKLQCRYLDDVYVEWCGALK
jgi:hypothetical protein